MGQACPLVPAPNWVPTKSSQLSLRVAWVRFTRPKTPGSTARSLRPTLQYLEAEGVLSLPKAVVPRSAFDELLDEYEHSLIKLF